MVCISYCIIKFVEFDPKTRIICFVFVSNTFFISLGQNEISFVVIYSLTHVQKNKTN